jgi:hypothetical protein
VVVSKEEVAVGSRKGSGGAWSAPQAVVEYEHWQRNKPGCLSIVGLSIAIWWCWKAPSRTFQPRPYEQLKVLSVLVQRGDAYHLF